MSLEKKNLVDFDSLKYYDGKIKEYTYEQAKAYADQRFNGANDAISFDSYSDMINTLNALSNDIYHIGQDIHIVTLDVPDLWISYIADTSISYIYVSDEAFITEFNRADEATGKKKGKIQIGYYVLSQLETQKVDLTDYEKIADNDAKLANKVDKVSDKGLSTNDYTTEEKNKLAGIAAGANKTVVDSYFSTASENPVQNKVISQKFTNLKTKNATDNIFDLIYPVGAIYLSMVKTDPAALFGGAWEPLPENMTLWLTSTNTTILNTNETIKEESKISEGLPNITGRVGKVGVTKMKGDPDTYSTGVFYETRNLRETEKSRIVEGILTNDLTVIDFNASNSNPIYGNSTTVQPPALRVYGWRRISTTSM